ncbi:MAG: hypothetical protein ACJA1A_002831 [Saprospiraceae bacterium]|jgi:hypothetical protein
MQIPYKDRSKWISSSRQNIHFQFECPNCTDRNINICTKDTKAYTNLKPIFDLDALRLNLEIHLYPILSYFVSAQ